MGPTRPRVSGGYNVLIDHTGKAERFIQTALREWAYSTHLPDSDQRNLALAPWTDYYNHARPHGSLHYQPPISRSEPGTTS